ncbi:N-acetylmuramoyl-L-alanine amidase [Paenibacillus thiaminolyticus]|uniref:peptidoglycan recognition protein family protein n=1 Tax=Paenibacillus thiaminolyticus TaxID=49283 RepID=UPI0035A69D5F
MNITVHNTDNPAPGATAEAHSRFIINGNGGAQKSWHYTVDDREIYQSLRDDEQGWHAGDGDGPGNTTSIGIEVCMYQGMSEPDTATLDRVCKDDRKGAGRDRYKPKQADYVGHWAEASIRRVKDAGIMNGRGNGFASNEPIAQAEIAIVVDCMLKQMGK